MSNDYYPDTTILKDRKFSAYNTTFEPNCKAVHKGFTHWFHKQGDDVGNTANDYLDGIWNILKSQAKWLEEKLGNGKGVSQEDLSRQTEDFKNIIKGFEERLKNTSNRGNFEEDLNKQTEEIKCAVLKGLDEKLKNISCSCKISTEIGKGVTQEDLNIHTQDIQNIVSRASKSLEEQNDEILENFTAIKKEIQSIVKEEDLDRKLGHTEKVIRDCLNDVEFKLSKLQKLGRKILEEVQNSSAKTEIEKLVMENNKILRKFDEQKTATQGDVYNINDNINNGKMLSMIQNQEEEIKGMLEEISTKIEKMALDKSVGEELGKAQGHLQKIAQLIGVEANTH